jgi:hypothetical protein
MLTATNEKSRSDDSTAAQLLVNTPAFIGTNFGVTAEGCAYPRCDLFDGLTVARGSAVRLHLSISSDQRGKHSADDFLPFALKVPRAEAGRLKNRPDVAARLSVARYQMAPQRI